MNSTIYFCNLFLDDPRGYTANHSIKSHKTPKDVMALDKGYFLSIDFVAIYFKFPMRATFLEDVPTNIWYPPFDLAHPFLISS